MKKTFLVGLSVSLLALAACASNTASTVNTDSDSSAMMDTSSAMMDDSSAMMLDSSDAMVVDSSSSVSAMDEGMAVSSSDAVGQ